MTDTEGPPEKPGEDATAAEIQEHMDTYDAWADSKLAEELRERKKTSKTPNGCQPSLICGNLKDTYRDLIDSDSP